MDSTVLFESIIYRKELPEYVDDLNKITVDKIKSLYKEIKTLGQKPIIVDEFADNEKIKIEGIAGLY